MTIKWMRASNRCSLVALFAASFLLAGCKRDSAESRSTPLDPTQPKEAIAKIPAAPIEPQTYETNADDLLAMRLDVDRASEGWIRLFDGHTLFGWEIATAANFRIEDQTIVVDAGDAGLMCTSMPWKDYELHLEYKADPKTDSGVFLRTSLQPESSATECYEVSIAGTADSFPTGSLAERQEVQGDVPVAGNDGWQTMKINLLGGEVVVSIDDVEVCRWTDENPLPAGRIGLQFSQGRIAFRDIQIKPLGLDSLIDDELEQWKQYPDMDGTFSVKDDAIVVDGGKTQLETKQSYDDFTLLAVYELASEDVNTGIFFRCIAGDEMMGYECQVNDGIVDENPLQPVDTGTGGIFRRQSARIVPGIVDQPNAVLLNVRGLQMAAWVNGIQVSNWFDDREANENPRRGSRTEAGTMMIQGHDPATRAKFETFRISR